MYSHPPRVRNYTTASILILLLYFLGWGPGFIVNLILLPIAAFQKNSSDDVQGFGCLVWLLIICGIVPILLATGLSFILLRTMFR